MNDPKNTPGATLYPKKKMATNAMPDGAKIAVALPGGITPNCWLIMLDTAYMLASAKLRIMVFSNDGFIMSVYANFLNNIDNRSTFDSVQRIFSGKIHKQGHFWHFWDFSVTM